MIAKKLKFDKFMLPKKPIEIFKFPDYVVLYDWNRNNNYTYNLILIEKKEYNDITFSNTVQDWSQELINLRMVVRKKSIKLDGWNVIAETFECKIKLKS